MREKRRLRRLKPSPAMVVSVVALVAAVAGTAVALPGKGSVQSNDIKKRAVKKRHIAPGAVALNKLAPGVRSVVTRPYAAALVAANGTVIDGVGISNANVTHPDTGQYCFNLSFNPTTVQATPEGAGRRLLGLTGPGNDFILSARARPDVSTSFDPPPPGGPTIPIPENCAGTEDGSVETANAESVPDGGSAAGDDRTYGAEAIDTAFYVEFR